MDLVGRRVRVEWPLMKRWYSGKITNYDHISGCYVVSYDDGDVEEVDFTKRRWVILNKSKGNGGTAPRAGETLGPTETTSAGAARAAAKAAVAVETPILTAKNVSRNPQGSNARSKEASRKRARTSESLDMYDVNLRCSGESAESHPQAPGIASRKPERSQGGQVVEVSARAQYAEIDFLKSVAAKIRTNLQDIQLEARNDMNKLMDRLQDIENSMNVASFLEQSSAIAQSKRNLLARRGKRLALGKDFNSGLAELRALYGVHEPLGANGKSFRNVDPKSAGYNVSPPALDECRAPPGKEEFKIVVATYIQIWLLENDHACATADVWEWTMSTLQKCFTWVLAQINISKCFEELSQQVKPFCDKFSLGWLLDQSDEQLTAVRRNYDLWDPPPDDNEWAIECVLLRTIRKRFLFSLSSGNLSSAGGWAMEEVIQRTMMIPISSSERKLLHPHGVSLQSADLN